MMDSLSHERLIQALAYDPSTGLFSWLIDTNSIRKGLNAGSACPRDRYIRIGIDGRVRKAHRLAWFYVHGIWPKGQIDHINGDRADNRICNLRDVTHSVNQQNLKSAKSNNKSCGLLGVTLSKGRWQARIRRDGLRRHLGLFDTPAKAHEAYLLAKNGGA